MNKGCASCYTTTRGNGVSWETPVIPNRKGLCLCSIKGGFFSICHWFCEISFSHIPCLFFFFNSTNIAIDVFLLASITPISPLKLWRIIQIDCSEYLLMSAKMKSWRISWEGPQHFGGGSCVFIWQSLYRLQRHCLPWHQFNVWLKFPKCCFVSKQWETGSEWELPCSLWDKLGEEWNVTEPFCLVPFTLF